MLIELFATITAQLFLKAVFITTDYFGQGNYYVKFGIISNLKLKVFKKRLLIESALHVKQ